MMLNNQSASQGIVIYQSSCMIVPSSAQNVFSVILFSKMEIKCSYLPKYEDSRKYLILMKIIIKYDVQGYFILNVF